MKSEHVYALFGVVWAKVGWVGIFVGDPLMAFFAFASSIAASGAALFLRAAREST